MKLYAHRITVIGKGSFPMDMLRTDRCYPADSNSVAAISRGDGDEFEVVVETVRVSRSNPFTIERWRSFRCSVENYTWTQLS